MRDPSPAHDQVSTRIPPFYFTNQLVSSVETILNSDFNDITVHMFIQNATDDKQPPSWLTTQNLTELGQLADFTMKLMFNSVAKKRITAGEWCVCVCVCVCVYT